MHRNFTFQISNRFLIEANLTGFSRFKRSHTLRKLIHVDDYVVPAVKLRLHLICKERIFNLFQEKKVQKTILTS